jgi:hypothetical protein
MSHIEILKESGHDVSALQLGLDEEPIISGSDPWNQQIKLTSARDLYI